MKWSVSLRAAAVADLCEARDWYQGHRSGLRLDFLVAAAGPLARLETEPEYFPVYCRGFRRVMTQRFPYRLLFQIEEEALIGFRILHAARERRRHLP